VTVRTTGVTAPPTRAWTLRFALIWLGLWAAQLAPVQLLLPLQLEDVDAAHKVRDFGLVNGVAGVAALLALPVFGALCDRTRSRFGRRRVWVAGGVAVYVVGLLLTGVAGD
jgi:MFS family permease